MNKENQLIQYGKQKGWWRNGMAFRYHFKNQLFNGVSLEGRKVLDVGCGNGRFAMWAAAAGASEVVGLEPSIEGSRGKVIADQFQDGISAVGLDNARLQEVTFQDFESQKSYWDVILLNNSINHLDEDACITLLEKDESRQAFLDIMNKLREIIVPGGDVIITDCSNKNYYGDRGEQSPFAPTIEWHKHQPPEVWASLMEECGFKDPIISWPGPARYMFLSPLFGGEKRAYKKGSVFHIRMTAGN